MRTAESPIDTANELVDIVTACELVGMDLPWGGAGSMKLFCPFGEVSHSDGGRDKSFRIYEDTNSAHCFACATTWRPVSLVATAKDITEEAAAQSLLESKGYRPKNVDDILNELIREDEPQPSQESLARALSTFCARISPEWEDRQLDTDVSRAYRMCLEPLSLVTDAAGAERWLAAAKTVMTRALEKK